jgi:hypothetical protein
MRISGVDGNSGIDVLVEVFMPEPVVGLGVEFGLVELVWVGDVVGEDVGDGVAVGVGDDVGSVVGVGVGVGVSVGVGVGVSVGVGVGVGAMGASGSGTSRIGK